MKMESRFGIDDVFSVIKAIIVWGLIVFGSLEAVWGLLQVYGYEPSNHSLYALTGSFYNPGPYSGFLAMCLPVALHEWLEGKRVWKHLALAALVLMLVVLPSGMSRSAWLAALMASGYVWAMHRRKKLHRYWKTLLGGGLLLILLGIGAYHWKKDSADGRLLMWKIAAQAVLEHPWQGVGWENVAGAYGDAQERYFASGAATTQEEHVAGAPEYVFNEYLQVGIAWGVPALCGILLVVVGCFCLGHRGRLFGVCGALLSLAVFSFSSYPFQFLLAKLYAEHPKVFPKEKLGWAAKMVLEKEAKVESTAIRQMREKVKIMLEEKEQ